MKVIFLVLTVRENQYFRGGQDEELYSTRIEFTRRKGN